MAWISVHDTVFGPKLRDLYKALNSNVPEAVGILVVLWHWGRENADKDGNILNADEEDISRFLYGQCIGCKLDFDKVVEALIETGWIDRRNGQLSLHDWSVWQDQWYKAKEKREADTKRKREARQRTSENASSAPASAPASNEEKPDESSAVSFSDINSVPWAETAIKALAKKNIINGVGNNKFEPNGTVTRAQFVKMLVLALELPMEFSEAPFDDVTAADWFYHYVHTAYKNGIVKGASSFGSERAITRAEMAVMCYRAAEAGGIKTEGNKSLDFKDSGSIPDYAKEAVAALVNNGIINGMGDNTFAPGNTSSRAQAAKIIYGILQLKGGID